MECRASTTSIIKGEIKFDELTNRRIVKQGAKLIEFIADSRLHPGHLPLPPPQKLELFKFWCPIV